MLSSSLNAYGILIDGVGFLVPLLWHGCNMLPAGEIANHEFADDLLYPAEWSQGAI